MYNDKLIKLAGEYEIEAGKPRLFSFSFRLHDDSREGQDSLVNWFWDGYLLIAHWFDDKNFSHKYYELPQVQKFLLFFSLLAQHAFHRTLDAELVYAFLRLCEDTHDAILEHYHRPR